MMRTLTILLLFSFVKVLGQPQFKEPSKADYDTVLTMYEQLLIDGTVAGDEAFRKVYYEKLTSAKEWAETKGTIQERAVCTNLDFGFLYLSKSGNTYEKLVVANDVWLIREHLPMDMHVRLLTELSHLYQRTKRPADRLRVVIEKCELENGNETHGTCDQLGAVYHDLKQYDKAVEYYRHDIQRYLNEDNLFMVAAFYNNVGLAYRDMQKADSAIANFSLAMKILEDEAEMVKSVRKAYLDHFRNAVKWNFLHAKEEYSSKEKIAMAKAVIQTGRDIPEYIWVVKGYRLLAQNSYSIKENGHALLYVDSAIAVASEGKFMDELVELILLKGRILLAQGDQVEADKNFERSSILRDSVELAEAALDASIAAAEYKSKEMEAELQDVNMNALMEKERAEREHGQKLWLLGIASAILALLVIVLLLLRASRNKTELIAKRTEELDASMVELDRSNKEKEVLLKEIHHRVKNNLQVISSLLDLQTIKMDDKVAKAALEEGKNRVQSIAILHHQLYRHDNMAQVDLNTFANELIQQVMSVFKKPEQQVDVVVNLPDVLIDIDTAVPLGLILNELFTNSFKYAFQLDKLGEIKLFLNKEIEHDQDSGRTVIIYRDDGPGLPADFNLSKANSLGLRLVSKLSKQFKGTTQYRFNNGAEFSISMVL